jgi:hypothetical protein
MAVARDANLMGVRRVHKGTPITASGMVGEGGANMKDVPRVHKDGQISVLGMVGAVVASSKDVVRARNGGQISALSTERVCWAVTMIFLKLCLLLQKRSAEPRNPKRQPNHLGLPMRMSPLQLLLEAAHNRWVFFE